MSPEDTSADGRGDAPLPLARFMRLNDAIERALHIVVIVMFSAFIGVVVLQVVGRNLLRFLTLLWTIDVALMMFIWSVYLGSALAVRRNVHYIIELLPANLRRINAVFDIVAGLLTFIVLYIFVFAGIQYLENAATRVSLAIGLSQVWFYLAIPVAGVVMALFLIEVLLLRLRALPAILRGVDDP